MLKKQTHPKQACPVQKNLSLACPVYCTIHTAQSVLLMKAHAAQMSQQYTDNALLTEQIKCN